MFECGLFGLVAVAIRGVNARVVGRGILPSCDGFVLGSSCLVSIVAFVTVMVLACRMVVGWVVSLAACACDKVTKLFRECTGQAGCGVLRYFSSSLRYNRCGLTVMCVRLSLFVTLSEIS